MCAQVEPKMRQIGLGPLRGLPLPARARTRSPAAAVARAETTAITCRRRRDTSVGAATRTRLDPEVRREQIIDAAEAVFAERDPRRGHPRGDRRGGRRVAGARLQLLRRQGRAASPSVLPAQPRPARRRAGDGPRPQPTTVERRRRLRRDRRDRTCASQRTTAAGLVGACSARAPRRASTRRVATSAWPAGQHSNASARSSRARSARDAAARAWDPRVAASSTGHASSAIHEPSGLDGSMPNRRPHRGAAPQALASRRLRADRRRVSAARQQYQATTLR